MASLVWSQDRAKRTRTTRTSSHSPFFILFSILFLSIDHFVLSLPGQELISSQMETGSSLLAQLPPLLPPLLLLLKLSQWWYSPSSPRTTVLAGEGNRTAATHASILPPRPLPILPSSGFLPPTPPTTPPASPTALPNIDQAETERRGKGKFEIGSEGYGICPLCGNKWQNPAILPSGWVVCWRCGWDAVEGEDEIDQSIEEMVNEDSENTEDAIPMQRVSRRRGKCPITGVAVAPGELRRVLV